MASVDSEAIQNFEMGYRKAAADFNSSEYLYFSDYNQGSYPGGIVKFDTLTAKDQFWIPADSYLMLPIAVYSSDNAHPYVANDPISFKTSILDLITGIQINSGSGQTLVNDQSVQYINTIRRLLDTSFDAQYTNMNELQLWKDTSLPATLGANAAAQNLFASQSQWAASIPISADNSPRPFILTNDTGVGGTPILPITSVNPLYNEGFDNRIRLFKANSTVGTSGLAAALSFNMTLFLPLRYIHPFFEKLDFPIINTRFQINFYTPLISDTAAVTINCPFLTATANSAATQIAMPAPAAKIVGPTFMYYRKVTYSPEDSAKVGAMIAKGHKITMEYPSMDFYPSIGAGAVAGYAAGSKVTDLVSPSTVAPLRVWQLMMAVGYVAGSLANIQQEPFVTNTYLVLANILINSQRYYDNDLGGNGLATARHDFWEVLDEQTVGHGFKENLGTLIGFRDFLTNYAFQVYDVSRLKNRLPNPSEAVNLQVQWTSAAANPPGAVTANSIPLYLVERNTVAELIFSSGAVSVAIGSQAT